MKSWEQALAAAVKQRWKRYRTALKRCQRKFSANSIHASRIAARRLAAQLDLLRPFAARDAIDEARRELKKHLTTFNALRDAQVQLVIMERHGGAIAGAHRLRKLTKKRERDCRREARRRIRRVKTRHVREVVRDLVATLEERSADPRRRQRDFNLIIRAVDAAFARLVQRRKCMTAEEAATIHRARVAFKSFRYIMESARLLCPGIRDSHFKRMSAFQDRLGSLQDTDVFLAWLDKLVAKGRVEANGVEPVRIWLVRRRQRQIEGCLRRADEIFEFWPVAPAFEPASDRQSKREFKMEHNAPSPHRIR